MANAAMCKECEGTLIPIVYGMPNKALMDAATAGRVSLGGCMVVRGDPQLICRDCGASVAGHPSHATEGGA